MNELHTSPPPLPRCINTTLHNIHTTHSHFSARKPNQLTLSFLDFAVQPHRQDMSGAPTGTLPQLTYPSNAQNGNAYYLPRQYAKKMPLATNNDGFIISSNAKAAALPPISNPNLNSSVKSVSGAVGQTVSSEAWSKPRLITIVRATEKPRKKISILLNRKVYLCTRTLLDIVFCTHKNSGSNISVQITSRCARIFWRYLYIKYGRLYF